MFNVEEMRRACSRFDWTSCRDRLIAEGSTETPEVLEKFVDEIIRSGCLILPREDANSERQRNAFEKEITLFLAENHEKNLIGRFESHLLHRKLIEVGYRQILRTLSQSRTAELLPEVHGWALLTRVARLILTVHEMTQNSLKASKDTNLFDASNFALRDENGDPLNPDAVIDGWTDALGISLKMLAYQNGWFESNGFLVLPPASILDEDCLEQVDDTISLATVWQMFERCETRLRFFGGQLSEVEIDSPGGDSLRKMKCLRFRGSHPWEILEHIASSRLNYWFRQNLGKLLMETQWETRTGQTFRHLLPPNGFISLEEVHSIICLGELLHFNVAEDEDEYSGLRLAEWVRGYSGLQEICREADPNSPLEPGFVSSSYDSLVGTLEGYGLTQNKIRKFLDSVTFCKDSKDLFDAPLLRCPEGQVLLFRPTMLYVNITKLVLSTLSSMREPVQKKGESFEQHVRQFFRDRGLMCEKIRFNKAGKEYECDAVLLMDNYLFLFECKNYPSAQNVVSRSYYFCLNMMDAIKQVQRLARAVSVNPDVVSSTFGQAVTWDQIIPCVLNATPWSSGTAIDGVYIYDFSALARFFERRHMGVHIGSKINDQARLLWRHGMHDLWKAEKPTADALLRQIKDPMQMQIERNRHVRFPFRMALSETYAMESYFLRRSEQTLENYLDAMGLDAEEGMKELAQIEYHIDQLTEKMRGEFKE
jgi:hypothetical protein